MILLDTNVVSELMRGNADARVLAWVRRQADEQLATSVVTVAEIGAGLSLLPAGARRRDLFARWQRLLAEGFGARILPVDSAAAEAYGEIYAARQRAGRPTDGFDLLIAAIARHRGLTVATRNVKDFDGCGVDLVNPWSAAAPA